MSRRPLLSVLPVALALALGAISLLPSGAAAEREHTVRAGQSLARIARRYGVAVTDLAAANGLRTSASLRPGQVLVIPEEGVHYVQRGETLSSIARRHEVSIRDLQRINRLREGQALRVGQRILLPSYERARARDEAAEQWGRPRRPGVAKLYRPALRQRLELRLVDPRGRQRSAAIQSLKRLFRHRRTGQMHDPHPRLVRLLAEVSDHFGGREITVLSGFRPVGGNTREGSRHTQGHAMDIRIRGVSNPILRDYVRTFDSVGVGYYPRSTFVHLDVRDQSAYWVDWSRPGEPPQYRRPSDADDDPPPDDEESEVDEDQL